MPRRVGRTEHCKVGPAVAVVIARLRDIARHAECSHRVSVGRAEDMPLTISVNSKIGSEITIVIRGHHLVGSETELGRACLSVSGAGGIPPRAGVGPEDNLVGS